MTALVQAEEDGTRLNEDELVSMIFLLLIAGHETTVNLIGNGMLALLQHPDQMSRLRDEPGIIKSAVEELLRYDGPLETATERYAREDVDDRGCHDSSRRVGLRRARLRQPGRAAVPRSGLARIFLASRTGISPSASGSTTASVRRSPGSRARLRSARWSADSRTFG